jgi:hypothetical protein
MPPAPKSRSETSATDGKHTKTETKACDRFVPNGDPRLTPVPGVAEIESIYVEAGPCQLGAVVTQLVTQPDGLN